MRQRSSGSRPPLQQSHSLWPECTWGRSTPAPLGLCPSGLAPLRPRLSTGLALAQVGHHLRLADHPRLVVVADLHQAATDPGRHAPGAG